jgi:farnesyl diphosphate synthase
MTDKPVEAMSFEEAMAELESIVGRLEGGEVALEASIALYKRGDALRRHCEARACPGEGPGRTDHAGCRRRAHRQRTGRSGMSFPDRLARATAPIGPLIAARIDALPPAELTRAMAYAAEGGKRLRGFLVLAGARLYDADAQAALHAAAAVECIHAYSLVHDDLPAMDDDDLRRGRPTVHVKWDEATAILVGDALQSLAFELLATPQPIPADRRVMLLRLLAEASGAAGMALGQAEDIAAEAAGRPLDLPAIEGLQARKTGALIEWAGVAGPVLAGADPAPMRAFADNLGRAFQIADDILDATGDAAVTGKRVGKDAEAGKATFVSLLGLDGARARARALTDAAIAALDGAGPAAEDLRAAARFVIARKN